MKRNFKTSTRILLLLSLLVSAVASTAQDTASAEKQISEFEVNGLKVIVKRRVGTPTVAAGLFIKGGTRELTMQNAGIESFMLSVAAEGSVGFPRAVLRRELAKTGSSIGTDSNYDYSVFSMVSTAGHFERTWKIFADVVINPAFAANEVELTRGKISTLLQTREDSPDTSLQMLVDRTILNGTSYGKDPIGTPDTIARFTAADLSSYHKKILTTSRLLLVVVGNVETDQIKSLVTASFGKLPRGNYKSPAVPMLDFSRPTLDISNRSLPTNYINGIFAAPSLKDLDYVPMRVAVSLLASRVFQEVRVKRNLSYAPDANLGSLAANTGAIYVTAVDANQAVRVMLDEINKLKKEPVATDEIATATGYFLTNHYLKQETNAAQVGELARYELIGGGWQNSLRFLDGVRSLKADEIQAVAKKYMKNLRFMVVGNPSDIDRSVFLQN